MCVVCDFWVLCMCGVCVCIVCEDVEGVRVCCVMFNVYIGCVVLCYVWYMCVVLCVLCILCVVYVLYVYVFCMCCGFLCICVLWFI